MASGQNSTNPFTYRHLMVDESRRLVGENFINPFATSQLPHDLPLQIRRSYR